jgi:hypothetical protein
MSAHLCQTPFQPSGTPDRAVARAWTDIQKVSQVNRYVLTDKGRKFATGLQSASVLDIESLMEKAAWASCSKNKEMTDCSTANHTEKDKT